MIYWNFNQITQNHSGIVVSVCYCVTVDITTYHRGFHGDLNETMFVGAVSDKAKLLVQTTHECLARAIAAGMLSNYIADNNMLTVKDYRPTKTTFFSYRRNWNCYETAFWILPYLKLRHTRTVIYSYGRNWNWTEAIYPDIKLTSQLINANTVKQLHIGSLATYQGNVLVTVVCLSLWPAKCRQCSCSNSFGSHRNLP